MLRGSRQHGQIETEMEPSEKREKLNGILEAIASGRTCEEILAADHTLSYHDIFHAVAEAPTSYWEKVTADEAGAPSVAKRSSARTPLRHRTD